MPAQPSSSVPHELLITSLWRCFPSASTVYQQSPSLHPMLSAQYLQPSCYVCAGPTVWNSARRYVGSRPSADSFRQSL